MSDRRRIGPLDQWWLDKRFGALPCGCVSGESFCSNAKRLRRNMLDAYLFSSLHSNGLAEYRAATHRYAAHFGSRP